MRRPRPLPPGLNRGGFSIAQAREAGITAARLRASDLTAPFYAVRSVGAIDSTHARALALSARLRPDQYFSHTTAAVLLGLRMPEGFRERDLHVTSTRPHRAARLAGVIGHESGAAATIMLDGVRVLNPIDTWVQLAATLTIDDLVVMGDGLLRRSNGIATVGGLAGAVGRAVGRGVRRLRPAHELVRPGTDSARETRLRLLVLRAGFPEPEVNGVIVNSFGAAIAHGDLVFRDYSTILEYEGRQHATDPRQFGIDIRRLDELMDDGWRVIRVDSALLAQRAVLIGKIDRALRRAGWAGTST